MSYRGNGCGPKGFIGKLIPDSLLGVSVHKACNLHDKRYFKGGSSQNRKKADQNFLKDMLTLIDQKEFKLHRNDAFIIKGGLKIVAYLYYYSVRIFGGFFFGGQESKK